MEKNIKWILQQINCNCILLVACLMSLNVFANTTFFVTSAADTNTSGTLRFAIGQSNTAGGTNTIIICSAVTGSCTSAVSSTIFLTADLPVITTPVTVCYSSSAASCVSPAAGAQQTIQGNASGTTPTFRIFATYGHGSANAAQLTLNNLRLQYGLAQGGSGGSGGGGGMGAGSAAYTDLGQTLTLNNTSFINCTAQGGGGGGSSQVGGGGGASWSINAKNASSQVGAGDFPGNQSSGGPASEGVSGYGGGGGSSDEYNNNSGGTGGTTGSTAAGGISDGTGHGANGGYFGGGGGAAAQGTGGGGGGNSGGNASGTYSTGSGGGGGGGGYGSGGASGSGSAGAAGGGGGGGFGGGGGSGNFGSLADSSGGGGGGFGGGGGGGGNTASCGTGVGGCGGSYGGNGGGGNFPGPGGGGGGAGIGAIFVGDGGSLIIGDYPNNNMLPTGFSTSGNQAIGGAGGAAGVGASGTAGSPNTAQQTVKLFNDIFLFKGASITFNGSNNLTVPYSIQADTAAPTSPAGFIDAGVTINAGSSSAVITFTATTTGSSTGNTYQGNTTITNGNLAVASNTSYGTGTFSMGGGGFQASTALASPVTNAFTLTAPSSLNGSNSFTINGTVTLNAHTLTVGNTAGTITLGGIISGAAGSNITVNGGSTLILSNASNSFVGTLSVSNASILSVAADGDLGGTSNGITLNNGTLTTTAGFTLNSGRAVSMGAGGGTFNPTGTLIYNGSITGSTSLTVNSTASGTLQLGATSAFTGAVNVTAGTLLANAANVISNSTGLVMSSSATAQFNLNGFNQQVGSLSGGTSSTVGNIVLGANTLTVNQTAPGSYGGVISGSTGNLTLIGGGTLTLSNSNTYTGTTTISAGTLQAGATNVISSSTALAMSTVATAAFNLNGFNQMVNNLSGGTSSTVGNIVLGNNTLTINLTAPNSYGGVISGASGNLTLIGGNTLTLTNSNTYTGTTTVTAGTLQAGAMNVIASSTALAMSTSATAAFNLNGFDQTVGSLLGGTSGTVGNIVLGSNKLTVNQTAPGSYGGFITGVGGNLTLSASSNNTLTLTGTNSYTGGTTINGGTLAAGGANLPTSGTLSLTAGTLNITGGSLTTSGALSLTGGTFTNAATITNNGAITINGLGTWNGISGSLASSTSFAIGTTISTNNNITNSAGPMSIATGAMFTSGGTFLLSGGTLTVTGTGSIVNTGTMTLNTSCSGTGSGSNSGTMTVSSTFGLSGGFINSNLLTFNAGTNNSTNVTNNATFNITGPGTIMNSATLTNTNGATLTVLNATLSTGTIVNNFGGTLTFDGVTNSDNVNNAGTFIVTNATSHMNSSNSATIANTGTSMSQLATMSVNCGLSGGGTINNNAFSTTTLLNNANVGNAIINNSGGTLILQGGSTAGAITNNTGATMQVTGAAIAGAVSNSGTVDIDTTTLNLTTFTNSSPGIYKVNTTNSANGEVISSGNLDLTNLNIQVTSSATATNSWTIFHSTGGSLTSTTGTTFTFPLMGAWSHTYTGNSVIINFSVANIAECATGQYNIQLANLLDFIAQNSPDPAQTTLVNYFIALSCAQQNAALQQMVANINVDTADFVVFNSIIDKVEARAAAPLEKNHLRGISYGAINPHTSFWLAGLGNFAKQKQNAEGLNTGYRLRAAGGLGGIDTKLCNDVVLGLAFGSTNANVYEMSNTNFITRNLSFYGLFYGSGYRKNSFLEWVVAGATGKNTGTRAINVDNANLSVASSYRNQLAGFKFNVGNFSDGFKQFRYSYLLSLQYSYLHQPAYSEFGNVTALKVRPQENQSLLTVGSGVRLSLPGCNPWLTGSREVRALVTYDVIQPSHTTNMNFVVGSPNFFIVNAGAPRLGYQVGVDFAVTICKRLQLQLSYDYAGRSGFYDNVGEVKLRFLF